VLLFSPLRLLNLIGVNPTRGAGGGRLNEIGRVGGWREALKATLETGLLGVILAFHGSGAGVGIQIATRGGRSGKMVQQGGRVAPVVVVVRIRVGVGRGMVGPRKLASASCGGSATLGMPGDLASMSDNILVF
jgi:hypothetical protein